MLLLALIALLAGASTAISPCVLPVLPGLLAVGATGGRRRPLGIVLGLVVTFTISVVAFARLASGGQATRDISIAVLIAAGILLLVPPLAARVEAPLSRLARFGPKTTGTGFVSGLAVGAAFGFVYFPCAGPILAAVIAVGSVTGRTLLIGGAYAVGSAAMLFALMLLGRRLLGPLRKGNRLARLQQATGVLLIATAVALATNLDIKLTHSIAKDIPDVNLAYGLETSHAVKSRLHEVSGRKAKFVVAHRAKAHGNPKASSLPDYGPAPEFADTQRWFNSPPLTMHALRGKVVLIDFWTYTCINCIRTLPYLKAWYAKYHRDGLVIVGVHSPEFGFEHDAGNVQRAIREFGLRYPVVQDNNLGTWNAWSNQAWPAEYLVDERGRVRHVSIGEGEYDASERAIRSLLAEAGAARLGAMAKPKDVVTPSQEATPETYVGHARAQGFTRLPELGTHAYDATAPSKLPISRFALGGIWTVGEQPARAGIGATLGAKVHAKDIYVVLSPPRGHAGTVQVSIDGRLPRTVRVTSQRLYHIGHFPAGQTHALLLRPQPGVAVYSFTFG
jgi:cytochrome c biogenesis protein CcdA/thiol-disulfide isomerase/thioredoxin